MEDKSYEVWFVHQYFSLYFFVMHAEDRDEAIELATQLAKDENVPNWMTELAQEINVENFDKRFVY